MKQNLKNNPKYTFAVGRRKSSSARVRLFKGKGISLVNGNKTDEKVFNKPFVLTDTLGKFYFSAKSVGGGKTGQTESIVLGIARALVKVDSDKYRSSLKKEGMLTRDARKRQRRMVGTGGKSRRQKQSPKR